MKTWRIHLAGFGTVGAGLWHHLESHVDLISRRTESRFEITKIACRDPHKATSRGAPADRITTDLLSLATDPGAEILVELIGGIEPAYSLIKTALLNGKHVVTANKALLAAHGEELLTLAAKQQRHLLFEASVAGAVPIIKAIRESLAANKILSIHGIINGTCNYILTQMTEKNLDYATALAEAKQLGYAEADESLDVDGHDTAHKAIILAALAYGTWADEEKICVEGIRNINRLDLDFAARLGYSLKLLAIIQSTDEKEIDLRVHPTLLPQSHVLASVKDVFNAIAVRGDALGEALFYGRGAGALPTTSAVAADLIEIARNPTPTPTSYKPSHAKLKPISEVISRYYLRLNVIDRPGVLAQISSILARHQIGISSVIQPKGHEGDWVPLILMVHDAQEAAFQNARQEIETLPIVAPPAIVIRVEDFE
ncbi:MAG: homoserine dehydrogenase [Methylacidiphilales bacterium]|nr:homoserine dehydrogenase [Candidatus Methylacidiphilales bacterium]MDW8349142.1 homoserine dehydrogenase [Verrucomicrobiae bacterium]